jgi:predicted Zn-ribbon and HTH transcriptional regulator
MTTQYRPSLRIRKLANSQPSPLPFERLINPANGQRAIRLADGLTVPVDLLTVIVGKHKWMRQIGFNCEDCGVRLAAEDFNPGSECRWCPTCQEAGIED